MKTDLTILIEKLDKINAMAIHARSTSCDAGAKWKANGELVKIIRDNIFTIINSLRHSAEYITYASTRPTQAEAKKQLAKHLLDLQESIDV